MYQQISKPLLLLGLSLSLAACGVSSLPAATSEATPDPAVFAPATDAPENAVLEALAVRPAKTAIDTSGGCRGVNRGPDYATCISSGLATSTTKAVSIQLPMRNFVSVTYKDLEGYCTSHLSLCQTKAINLLKIVYNHTDPPATCTYAHRTLQTAESMRRMKYGIVLGGVGVLAAANTYIGYKVKDYDIYIKALSTSGQSMLGAMFGEWAWNWVYTNSWNDSGASITAEMIIAASETIRNLPNYFNVPSLDDVTQAIIQHCPNPYTGAFENLPV